MWSPAQGNHKGCPYGTITFQSRRVGSNAQSLLNQDEMISPMLGAVQANRLADAFDLGSPVCAHAFNRLVNLLGGRECQLGSRAGWNGQAQRSRGFIDNIRIYRRWPYPSFNVIKLAKRFVSHRKASDPSGLVAGILATWADRFDGM